MCMMYSKLPCVRTTLNYNHILDYDVEINMCTMCVIFKIRHCNRDDDYDLGQFSWRGVYCIV